MRLDSIQFEVNGPTNECSLQGLTFDRLYGVKKSGYDYVYIPMASSTSTVTADAYSFRRKLEQPNTLDPNSYLIKTSEINVPLFFLKRQAFEAGPVVAVGGIYSLTDGTNTVSYTATGSDTPATILSALRVAINLAGITGVTASIAPTGRLVIEMPNSVSFSANLVAGTQLLYKSGLYCIYNGMEYMIGEAQSFTSYPVIPALSSSYNFNDLDAMPLGLQVYTDEPGYNQTELTISNLGTTNLTGYPAPSLPALEPYEVAVDEANDRLVFAVEFDTSEIVTLLYI